METVNLKGLLLELYEMVQETSAKAIMNTEQRSLVYKTLLSLASEQREKPPSQPSIELTVVSSYSESYTLYTFERLKKTTFKEVPLPNQAIESVFGDGLMDTRCVVRNSRDELSFHSHTGRSVRINFRTKEFEESPLIEKYILNFFSHRHLDLYFFDQKIILHNQHTDERFKLDFKPLSKYLNNNFWNCSRTVVQDRHLIYFIDDLSRVVRLDLGYLATIDEFTQIHFQIALTPISHKSTKDIAALKNKLYSLCQSSNANDTCLQILDLSSLKMETEYRIPSMEDKDDMHVGIVVSHKYAVISFENTKGKNKFHLMKSRNLVFFSELQLTRAPGWNPIHNMRILDVDSLHSFVIASNLFELLNLLLIRGKKLFSLQTIQVATRNSKGINGIFLIDDKSFVVYGDNHLRTLFKLKI